MFLFFGAVRVAGQGKTRTLPVAYFFSVVMEAPDLLAALSADWPRTTVSRVPPPLRTFLPILTSAVSQADILTDLWCVLLRVFGWL